MPAAVLRRTACAALAAAAVLLAGCSALPKSSDSFLGVITPYRVDIVQGNVVTREQAALVRPGMTRAQVRDLLGSPLLTDPFHADRWDFVFTIRRPGTDPQRRHVVAIFEGDRLKTLEAPELPSERDFVASISPRRDVRVPTLELTEEQRKALPPAQRREEPAPAPGPEGPARPYPPLEPRAGAEKP